MLNLLNNLTTSSIEGLTNRDLEKLCKNCIYNFIGVYPSDSKPNKKKIKKNFSLIFNLSPHFEQGSHFIAVVKKYNKLYYFDSLNERKNNDISEFIHSLNLRITFCQKKIQSDDSIFCGLYCLAFLLYMQNYNSTPYHFYKFFSKNKKKNDVIVKKFILKEIKKIVCYKIVLFYDDYQSIK